MGEPQDYVPLRGARPSTAGIVCWASICSGRGRFDAESLSSGSASGIITRAGRRTPENVQLKREHAHAGSGV